MSTSPNPPVFWPTFSALMLFLSIVWVPFGILTGTLFGLLGPGLVGLALAGLGLWRTRRTASAAFTSAVEEVSTLAAGPVAIVPSPAPRPLLLRLLHRRRVSPERPARRRSDEDSGVMHLPLPT